LSPFPKYNLQRQVRKNFESSEFFFVDLHLAKSLLHSTVHSELIHKPYEAVCRSLEIFLRVCIFTESLESNITSSTLMVVPTWFSLEDTWILSLTWSCEEKYMAYVFELLNTMPTSCSQSIHHTGCFCTSNFGDFILIVSLKNQVGVSSIKNNFTKLLGFKDIMKVKPRIQLKIFNENTSPNFWLSVLFLGLKFAKPWEFS
jgi:hypothetical protein